MKSIFVSYHYDENGKKIGNLVRDLVLSHDLEVADGKRLAGGVLTDQIKNKIAKCDGLIIILTKRNDGSDNHAWVLDEITHSRAIGKKVQVLTEEGIQLAGMNSDLYGKRFANDTIADAIVEVSWTLGEWKREAGNLLEIVINPDEASTFINENMNDSNFSMQYKCWNGPDSSDWKKVDPIPEAGNPKLYLNGVQKEEKIQIQAACNGIVWRSRVEVQNLKIELKN